jgi:hypothetical protein
MLPPPGDLPSLALEGCRILSQHKHLHGRASWMGDIICSLGKFYKSGTWKVALCWHPMLIKA